MTTLKTHEHLFFLKTVSGSFRSSHQRCSVKKGVLRNFAKFTGKRLYQRIFFNKVAALRSATLLKESLAQVFSREFCEISKNNFFTKHVRKTTSVPSYNFNIQKPPLSGVL